MRILGDLVFAGLGQIKNPIIDNVNADPSVPSVGQMWYNTVDGKYRGYDGTVVITFASGGSTALIQAELDNVESQIGLSTAGNYVVPTGSSYLGSSTTVMNALTALDGQLLTTNGNVTTNTTNIGLNLTEINAIETAVGLNTNGTFTAPTGTSYLGGATSVMSGEALLDTQVKANADQIALNITDISTRVLRAGDTMTGNLAFGGNYVPTGLAAPVNGTDAVNKNYLDNLAAGITWKNAVKSSGATNPATATTGDRFLNFTDGKIYTATATNTWGTGVAPTDGDAVFDAATETGFIYAVSMWTQFTGLGQVTAGVGLSKSGNQMSVQLGAGVAQLPTNEVGLDLYVNSGLFLTVDGSTAAPSNGDSQLSILLDGTTMALSSTGLSVAAGGITSTELNSSVAGAGLVGGGGSALAVNPGTGISVVSDQVILDLTYADDRYVNTTGDTMTGLLVLSADPTALLGAVTKQYADAITNALTKSFFVYNSGVTSATSHIVTHNIGSKYVNVTVIDGNDLVIIPDSVSFDSTSQITVSFASAITCKVVVSGLYSA